MTSDIISNLISGLYLLFAHNGLVFIYVLGGLISLVLIFFRPRRLTVLYFLSFLTLAFGFEYDKHIIVPLREQTVMTVVTNPETHLFTQRLINLFISEFIPVLLFILGWGLLFLAILLSLTGKNRKAVTTEKNA